MTPLITILGATGHVGSALAEMLLQAGVNVRVVARHAEKLAHLGARGAEAFAGDADDPAFLVESFRGADAVFAMIPPHATAPDQAAAQRRSASSIAEALRQSGVPRVVMLSSVGAGLPAGTGPIEGLYELEQMLKNAPGLAVVALRPAYFMENHLNSIHVIKTSGINGSPARADVAVPMIATRDIAAAAAEYLKAPSFESFGVRELLGPRDYSMREATEILGASIGNASIPYVEFSYDDFQKALVGAGISADVAERYNEMYRAFNEGRIQATLTRDDASTTPTTLAQFAREVFAPAYRAA